MIETSYQGCYSPLASTKKPRYSKQEIAQFKRDVLARMAEGYSQYAAINAVGLSTSTWYRWRRADPHLVSEINRISNSAVAQQQILKKLAKDDTIGESDWRVIFIKNYRRTRDRNDAANAADMTAQEVETYLDPSHENYDETFVAMMKEEDLRLAWSIEDAAKREAAAGNTQMRKFLLEKLMPEKYGRTPNSPNTTNNVFWFSQEGESKALEALSKALG